MRFLCRGHKDTARSVSAEIMKTDERREKIKNYLNKSREPVSASALAARFGVSRQIIVGDIALLRASGENIQATPKGYIRAADDEKGLIMRIACDHNTQDTEKELLICTDNGCAVLDVIVEHPVYGQITGSLQIYSRYDARQFMEKLKADRAHPLSALTDGIHLHTLRCPDMEAYERVCRALSDAGILIE